MSVGLLSAPIMQNDFQPLAVTPVCLSPARSPGRGVLAGAGLPFPFPFPYPFSFPFFILSCLDAGSITRHSVPPRISKEL